MDHRWPIVHSEIGRQTCTSLGPSSCLCRSMIAAHGRTSHADHHEPHSQETCCLCQATDRNSTPRCHDHRRFSRSPHSKDFLSTSTLAGRHHTYSSSPTGGERLARRCPTIRTGSNGRKNHLKRGVLRHREIHQSCKALLGKLVQRPQRFSSWQHIDHR